LLRKPFEVQGLHFGLSPVYYFEKIIFSTNIFICLERISQQTVIVSGWLIVVMGKLCFWWGRTRIFKYYLQ